MIGTGISMFSYSRLNADFSPTGSRKLDWAIVLLGFFLWVMKVVSYFATKDASS